MKPIILASESPRRHQLLKQMGVKFRVVVADTQEAHGKGKAARSICRRNASAKARSLAEMKYFLFLDIFLKILSISF